MKQLFAVAVFALSTLTAGSVSSKTYDINLTKPAKVGNTQLKAGHYKLVVEGSQATITEAGKAKNTVTVPVKMQEADKEDAIIVAITRDGKVFLSPGNEQVEIDNLSGKVKDLQTNRSDKTVYLKADARSKFEVVETVIDTLRTAAVDDLGLLTEEIQDRNKKSSTAL